MTSAEFITGCLTALNTAVIFMMWVSDRRNKGLESLEKAIGERLDKIERNVNDILEDQKDMNNRITFLEAASLYSTPIETIQHRSRTRSEAAKEMWRRRRSKQIEKKDKN